MILNLQDIDIKFNHAPYNNKYHVILSDIEFDKKPTAFKRLHDELDNKPAEQYTLVELLEEVTKGKTFKNGTHVKQVTKAEIEYIDKWKQATPNVTEKDFKKKIEQYKRTLKPVLKESNLAILDIDDVLGQSDPVEVMKETGAIALYYTFSHKTKSPINTDMQRYRLLFDLSDTVQGKEQLEYVQQEIKNKILDKYPYLHEQKFKSKAHGIDNLTKMFYGTKQGYEINKNFQTYDVAGAIDEFEKKQDFNQLINKVEHLSAGNRNTTDSEILDVASFLGDMNDQLDHREWTTLAIGLWNTAQLSDIDDQVIIEALQILDGNRNNDRYYLDFKHPIKASGNQASIGTMFKLATDKGYKRTYRQQPNPAIEPALEINTTTHRIEKYINSNDMLEILKNDNKKVLVVAPTNTGKTRSSVEASKEYLNQNEKAFIYIALPTIALSQQVVKDFNINVAVLGNHNVRKTVQQAIHNDTRLLVGTYDKTAMVHQYLNDYDVTIIADEVHKEVTDYSFRYEAIQNLFDIKAHKFIGLTGTPSELDLNEYDSMHTFKLAQPKILADTLQFVTYLNANHYENIVAKAIKQEMEQGNKVLAFVNNKKVITKLSKVLKKQGLNVETITADNRKSKTYKNILENQKFNDEVDVVLTTIVLADGVNIENTHNYVCMIAPSHYKQAHFHNINLIRQASNRFRNQYKKILVPLYVKKEIYNDPEHERTADDPYDMEAQYNYLLKSAEISKAVIQSEFKNNLNKYTPSVAERIAGLFRPKVLEHFNFERAYKNKQLANQGLNHDEHLLLELLELETKLFTIDKRSIRQQASKDKEFHYSMHPYAFAIEITKALEVLNVDEMLAEQYFLNKDKSIKEALFEISLLEAKSELDKHNNLKITLHEIVYAKIQTEYFQTGKVNESTAEWLLLKAKMNAMQYGALTKLVKFLDYDDAIRELQRITKKAQMYELVREFEAVNELGRYKETKSETVTELIFHEINNHVADKVYTSKAELDDEIEQLARSFKIKKRYSIAKRTKLFKQVFKRYFVTVSKGVTRIEGKKKKLTSYKVIDFNDMATKRKIEIPDIERMYKRFTYG